MGNRTKLTPEVQETIVEAIRLGATYKLAADAANVSYDSYHLWEKLGNSYEINNDPEMKIYYDFYLAIKKAKAEHAMENLETIRRHSQQKRNWTASAWLLERCHPEGYSKDAYLSQK